MERIEIPRKVRERIAEQVVKYLKNRLQLKQRIIKGNENSIALRDYIEYYKRCINYVPRADTNLDESIANLKRLLSRRVDYIVLTKGEIDEILKYVRESIIECGLDDKYDCGENEFARDVLNRLLENLAEGKSTRNDNKSTRVAMFRAFFSFGDNSGFDRRFRGRIIRNDEITFEIFNHEASLVCKFLDSGENVVTGNPLAKEVIAVSSELYFGFSNKKDEKGREKKTFSIFQERIVEGYRYMKAILSEGEEYDISDDGKPNTVEVVGSFKTILDLRKLGWMYSDAYCRTDILRVIIAYNNHILLGKEKVECAYKVSGVASEYWVAQQDEETSSFKFRDFLSKLSRPKVVAKPITVEQAETFKDHLKKRIMMNLLVYPSKEIVLSTSEKEISKLIVVCATLSGIDLTSIPKNKFMRVNIDKVTLMTNGSAEERVLFDVGNKDMLDGSSGPHM